MITSTHHQQLLLLLFLYYDTLHLNHHHHHMWHFCTIVDMSIFHPQQSTISGFCKQHNTTENTTINHQVDKSHNKHHMSVQSHITIKTHNNQPYHIPYTIYHTYHVWSTIRYNQNTQQSTIPYHTICHMPYPISHMPYAIYHTNHIIFRLHKCFFPGLCFALLYFTLLYFTLLTPRIHMLFILPSSHIFYFYLYLYFFLWQTPKIHPPTEFVHVHVHEHLTARLPPSLRLVFNSIQSVICICSGLI